MVIYRKKKLPADALHFSPSITTNWKSMGTSNVTEAREAGEECCRNVWIFWSGGREIIKASSLGESGERGKKGAGWEPHEDVAPALLPSKSTWTWMLPVWMEISCGNHIKKLGKKRRRRRSQVPSNPRPFACIKICGRLRCLLFLLWQITIPGKYYPADPVIFGVERCWTQRHESDAWMCLAGAGRCQGSPRVWPVFRWLHEVAFCGD